jgi:hypothetical protein
MEQSLLRFPTFYGTLKFHIKKSPTLVPTRSQMNPVQTFPNYLFNIHFIIILI